MSFKTGWVKVQDAFGQTATMQMDQFGDLLEINELDNFRQFIETHSDAKVIAAGISEIRLYDASGYFADGTDKGNYDSIRQRMVFHFRDAGTGRRFSFSIPAPRNEDLDADQQPKASVAKAVRDKVAELTGRVAVDLHYLGGGLRSKVPAIEQRRKKVG